MKATKKYSIKTAPNVLVVHLKRFDFSYAGKLTHFVSYPEILSLKPFMSNYNPAEEVILNDSSSEDHVQKNVSYKLYGVLVHLGFTSHSGHYYSYVRGPSDIWYKADDQQISTSQLQDALSQNAYLLFYSRIEAATPDTQAPSIKTSTYSPITFSLKQPAKDNAPKLQFNNSIPLKCDTSEIRFRSTFVPIETQTRTSAESEQERVYGPQLPPWLCNNENASNQISSNDSSASNTTTIKSTLDENFNANNETKKTLDYKQVKRIKKINKRKLKLLSKKKRLSELREKSNETKCERETSELKKRIRKLRRKIRKENKKLKKMTKNKDDNDKKVESSNDEDDDDDDDDDDMSLKSSDNESSHSDDDSSRKGFKNSLSLLQQYKSSSSSSETESSNVSSDSSDNESHEKLLNNISKSNDIENESNSSPRLKNKCHNDEDHSQYDDSINSSKKIRKDENNDDEQVNRCNSHDSDSIPV